MADDTGTIVAILLAVIAGVVLLFVIFYFFMIKKRRRTIATNHPPSFVDQNETRETNNATSDENGNRIFTNLAQNNYQYADGESTYIEY
jgi:hypothetical protein